MLPPFHSAIDGEEGRQGGRKERILDFHSVKTNTGGREGKDVYEYLLIRSRALIHNPLIDHA